MLNPESIKIAVTGYIGSHLVTMLVKAGYNVYAYVSANSDPVHIAFLKVKIRLQASI